MTTDFEREEFQRLNAWIESRKKMALELVADGDFTEAARVCGLLLDARRYSAVMFAERIKNGVEEKTE